MARPGRPARRGGYTLLEVLIASAIAALLLAALYVTLDTAIVRMQTGRDTVVSNDGARLLVDPLSIQYLMGSKVDYVEGLQGSKFIVENPMATTTCGCGMSFSI